MRGATVVQWIFAPPAGHTGRATQAPPPDASAAADEALLIAAAVRDRAAFAPLYRRYVTPVYRYFARQTANAQDAEDLTAATFDKALAGLDRYREQGAFAAWLFSIARHTLRDYQRRFRPHLDVDLMAEPPAAMPDEPEAEVLRGERLRLLGQRLRRLPADQQEAVALRFFAELGVAATARTLGRSEGAVRMLVHRAITTLRRDYAEEEQL
jgi:RNA polymerase sigma-70 factor, ECF subfamily